MADTDKLPEWPVQTYAGHWCAFISTISDGYYGALYNPNGRCFWNGQASLWSMLTMSLHARLVEEQTKWKLERTP